jgi:23S rRNA (uracil1939-C5)-methyltransferase
MPEVEITAMTFGPYGVAHADGKTIMVPNAAPGDRLEVEIASERRDYSTARIVRVIAPGPARRTPPCPFLPRCGGCDWQQIEYAAQVRLKGEVIATELARALGTGIDPATLVEPCEAEFGYRSRVRLRAGAGGKLGYRELASHRLVEIDRCLVADARIRVPHELARALGRDLDEIEAVAADSREVLVAHLRKPPFRAHLERARGVLEADPAIAGIVLRAGERREVLGNAEIEVEIEAGATLRLDADLFSQVNRAQNRKLVAAVMEMAAPAAAVALLDLFCGAGNFSIPAARRGARVTGVDADAPAIAAAAHNAGRLGLDASAQFVAMKAHEVAAFLHRARYRPASVILDPPRIGAAALMEPIARMRPARVVYVSCDVATLARDLRVLCAADYRLARVRAFDFFPNTHHDEIAACMVLT